MPKPIAEHIPGARPMWQWPLQFLPCDSVWTYTLISLEVWLNDPPSFLWHSDLPRSPCECDKAFVKCLKSAKTRVANALGKVFFNVAGLTCYKFDYPIKVNSPFLTFPACFYIPKKFSSLNSNCPNLVDMRNLQEKVKHSVTKHCSDLSLNIC